VVPQRDPLPMWAPQTIEMFQSALDREGIISDSQDRFSWHSDLAAMRRDGVNRHDYSVCLQLPATLLLALEPDHEYSVRYVPSIDDHAFVTTGSPDMTWDETFEYVVYGGNGRDGLRIHSGAVPLSGGIAANFRLPHPVRSSARLIGTVVGHVTRSRNPDQPERDDPGYVANRRLLELTNADPGLLQTSRTVESLTDMNTVATSEVVSVFVHGTASCSLQHLPDIVPVLGRVVRYEHDTYHPLDENSTELYELIQQKLPHAKIQLVGHSRGGVVARGAVEKLGFSGRHCDVITFGTPHAGSELVAAGSRLLDQRVLPAFIQSASGVATRLRPHAESSTDVVIKELCHHRSLPIGWREMAQNSEAIRAIHRTPRPNRVETVGSSYRPNLANASSSQHFLNGFIDGPNDGVISFKSARAKSTPTLGNLRCVHSNYFREINVQQHLAHSW
jgi:hypothetical protein